MLTQINDYITYFFIVELSLRFLAASSKRAFFAEFWLDILAVIPLFRIFRSARALRLLRVVRLFRLLGVFQRLSSHYPRIFRNNFVDFIIVSGMLLIAVVFGTIAITHFESQANLNRLSQNNLVGGNVPAGVNVEPGVKTPAVDPPVNDSSLLDPPAAQSVDFDLESSFWYSIYTLLAGEPVPAPPKTFSSRIVTVFLMLSGLSLIHI